MPHSQTSKNKKHLKRAANFPVMFYQTLPADKIKKGASLTEPPDLNHRLFLMWTGVIIVMIFLVGFWAMAAKEKIQTANQGGLQSDFEFLKKQELTEILREGNQKLNQVKNLEEIIKKTLTAAAASSSLPSSSIEELKKKIEKK